MPSDRELMKQALDALNNEADGWDLPPKQTREAIEALRARLAQPEQEPVAWLAKTNRIYKSRMDAIANGEQLLNPLCTAPPQREWQGLTDEDWIEIIERPSDKKGCEWDAETYGLIEAKLKEKNS